MRILSIITIIALAAFLLFPDLDMQVSSLFYVEGQRFPYERHPFSIFLYYSVRYLCILTAVSCLFALVYDRVCNGKSEGFICGLLARIRRLIVFSKAQVTYLFLVIVITPGIIVHWIMKPLWQRARPVNVEEFGGQYIFTDFWQILAGQDGKAFASGHASMSFALVALAFMVRQSRRNTVLVITLSYGFIASACRIWQGKHWLSDVTFGALITLWTILLVKRFYLDKNQ